MIDGGYVYSMAVLSFFCWVVVVLCAIGLKRPYDADKWAAFRRDHPWQYATLPGGNRVAGLIGLLIGVFVFGALGVMISLELATYLLHGG